jgi:hypothetical protein
MNRIEAQFQAFRYFTLDGTDHRSHEEQNSSLIVPVVVAQRPHKHCSALLCSALL